MQQLMRQAQKMQEDMMAAKEELAETEVTGTSGNWFNILHYSPSPAKAPSLD